MSISDALKVTTEMLWKAALIFALIDIVFISVLAKFVKPDDLKKMKWRLVVVMFCYFFFLFGLIMSYIYWDSVYSYVFPLWFRWIIPPSYGLLFALIGLLFWWLAFRLPGNPVVNFCLLGGLWGIATHVLAILRGILETPMLLGSSPMAALTIATFEFIFYWCVCLTISVLIRLLWSKLKKK